MKKVLPLFLIGLAVGTGAHAQGQLGQLLRSSSGGTGLVSLESSSTGNKTFTFSGPSGTVITSHLATVNLLTGAASGTVSINGTAGTANFTLTSLSGTAKTAIPSGYDRLLLANSSGLLDAVRISDVIGSTGWVLTGNATTSAWNGSAGSYLGTSSANPLVLATTNATAQAIRFYTGANGANQRMFIGADGKIGIGTSRALVTFAIGSDSTTRFGVDGATGNTTVAGTLGVTGAAAFADNVGITGDLAINTNKFTVDGTTGNTTVAGTLGVTGAVTASGGATVSGTASINTSGSSATNIGNASSATTIYGSNLKLTGVTTGTAADSILLISSTTVKKIAMSAATGSVTVSEQSLATAYALQSSDYLISCTNAAAGSVTLPTPSAVGKVYVVKSSAAGDVSVTRSGSDTIDGQTSYFIPGGAGLAITFVYVATNKWAVVD